MNGSALLLGQRVRLRAIEEGDLALFVRWFNDPEVRYWLAMSEAPEMTLEAERQWFAKLQGDSGRLVWCIETLEGRPIGNLGLHAINEAHGRATLGISIGDKEYWSRGYGTDAIRQALRYAFQELGLRRVDLQVDEDNGRGIRCYEKCGFLREGVLRHYRLRLGQPVNDLIMAVLRDQWPAGEAAGEAGDGGA